MAAARAGCSETGPVTTPATASRGSNRLACVGPDNRKAYRVAGDLVARLLGAWGGDVVMIAGLLSVIGHEEREAGFRSVLRERYPAVRAVEVPEGRERGGCTGDLVFRALAANPWVRGISDASPGARELTRALRAAGREGAVFVRHELTPERRALLKEGLIDALIDQGSDLEVRMANPTLAAHFGRAQPDLTRRLAPIQIILRESC